MSPFLTRHFALLLHDACIDKWIKRYHDNRRGEPRTPYTVGKYMKNEDVSSEYGGWSDEGTEMFNMLGGIVEDDRKSGNAREAEEWVLESLKEQVGGGARMRTNREMDPSALQRTVGTIGCYQQLIECVDQPQLTTHTPVKNVQTAVS